MSAAETVQIPAPRGLEGAEKAAALLLAMGKPAASRLLKHFDPGEMKEIARAAAGLGSIGAADLESVIEEFAREFATGMSLLGTAHEMEKLLTGVLPGEQISDIMTDALGQKTGTSIWERTSQISEAGLAEFLSGEHPQTAALILSRLQSETAAAVIKKLPERERNNIMRRMAHLKPVPAPAMRIIEGSLHEALIGGLGKQSSKDNTARMAEILNRMEEGQIDAVLSSIAEQKPETATALRRLLFRFEDIAKLSAKDRMTLFDQVPSEQVVLALAGTDAEFRELVLSSIASRARRIVEHELESAGEPDKRGLTDARRRICERVMELIANGEIEPNASESAGS